MFPNNKRIFRAARMSAPDGIRIDDKGRVGDVLVVLGQNMIWTVKIDIMVSS